MSYSKNFLSQIENKFMSAKSILCECPICKKEFKARSDQFKAAQACAREIPCCSNKCERERRYALVRDARWQEQTRKLVDGWTRPN